jgi:hypothetical protein
VESFRIRVPPTQILHRSNDREIVQFSSRALEAEEQKSYVSCILGLTLIELGTFPQTIQFPATRPKRECLHGRYKSRFTCPADATANIIDHETHVTAIYNVLHALSRFFVKRTSYLCSTHSAVTFTILGSGDSTVQL